MFKKKKKNYIIKSFFFGVRGVCEHPFGPPSNIDPPMAVGQDSRWQFQIAILYV